MKIRKHSKSSGMTLVEALIASSLGALVMTGVVSTLYAGTRSWSKGQTMIDAERSASTGMRALAAELREAMAVTVASDGNSVTYRLPSKDGTGAYVTPAVWDGVSRRAIVTTEGSQLVLKVGVSGSERTVAKGIWANDPEVTGAPTYRYFTAGAGSITREITVQLVTRRIGPRNVPSYQRIRETFYLRNIPTMTR